MLDLKNQLWIAKYAPTSFSETIMPEAIKNKIKEMIRTKKIPNLGFFGPAGTGKTTSALVLLKELGVDMELDFTFINASDVNSVDAVRDIIKPIAMSSSFNDELPIRFILLDEADHLSPQAQAALRSLMEASYGTARFILTANFPKKILEPIHSRLQTFTLEKPDVETVAIRVFDILEQENVKIKDEDALVDVISNNCADIRKLIQILQQNTIELDDGNKILELAVVDNETNVLFDTYMDLFYKRDNYKIRELIYKKFTDSDLDSFWDNMTSEVINNIKKIEKYSFEIDNIIYHLGQYQYLHNFVANKHLNLLALTEVLLQETE